MLLATIPVSATFPRDRLLTFVGIGAAGLLAQFWAFVFVGKDAPASAWWRVPARAVAWFLVAVHAVIAPIAPPVAGRQPARAAVGRAAALRPHGLGTHRWRTGPSSS